MIEYNSPDVYDAGPGSIFLGGSMTETNDWREHFIEGFKSYDVSFLSPYRKNQPNITDENLDLNDPAIIEHIKWVNNAIDDAWMVFLYFDPSTKSPLSLLDFADLCKNKKAIVCCPKDFWKSTIIKTVCIEFNVQFFEDLENYIEYLKKLNE